MTPELLGFIELFNRNVAEMFAYGRDMLRRRRTEPKADLMSAIANAEVDGERLPDEYLDGSWLLIVFAGNDTTRNTLSGGLKLFTENAGERERLMADGALLAERRARNHAGGQPPSSICAAPQTEEVEVAGQRIAHGEKVVMWYGAANHDPAVFPEPERFDIARANAERNIAFGHGPHICIGRLAAQMQLEESYRQIFAPLPEHPLDGRDRHRAEQLRPRHPPAGRAAGGLSGRADPGGTTGRSTRPPSRSRTPAPTATSMTATSSTATRPRPATTGCSRWRSAFIRSWGSPTPPSAGWRAAGK